MEENQHQDGDIVAHRAASMRWQIWAWAIPPKSPFTLSMPSDAMVLRVGYDDAVPSVWALIDQEAERKPRTFRIYMSGDGVVPREGMELIHCGSFQTATQTYFLFEERLER